MSASGDNEFKDYQPKKAIVNKPLQWTDLALSEQVKTLRFFRDKDNNIMALAVVPFDPTQTGLNVLPMGRVGISDPGALNSYARVFGLPCCGWPETTLGLVTHSTQMVQKDLNLEAQRTPTIFRTVLASAAGNTILWDPAANRRFRLLGLGVIVPNTATSVAGVTSTLTDGAGTARIAVSYIGATTSGFTFVMVFGQNGYLSTALNNNLSIENDAAYTVAGVRVSCWGTEEL